MLNKWSEKGNLGGRGDGLHFCLSDMDDDGEEIVEEVGGNEVFKEEAEAGGEYGGGRRHREAVAA